MMNVRLTLYLVLLFCILLCELEAKNLRKFHGHHKRQQEKNGRRNVGKHHDSHHGYGHKPIWDKHSLSGSDKHGVHMKKINWLEVPEVADCKCRHKGDICIRGPDKNPICVQKHHLQESTRLFKHYHDRKEAAEESLNEVDPLHHPSSPGAPHDVHINLVSEHKPPKKGHHQHKANQSGPRYKFLKSSHGSKASRAGPHDKGTQSGPRVKHQHPKAHRNHQQHTIHGLKPKHGKHVKVWSHTPQFQQTAKVDLDNLALDTKSKDYFHHTSCSNSSLAGMRQRLIGWFHLLHGQEHHHPLKSHKHLSVKKELRDHKMKGNCECLKSVMWEFRQLDTDDSHGVSQSEVKAIDNNDMEPCLHPYLQTCDKNGDGELSRKEWCCCFPQQEVESPCYAKLKEIEDTKNTEVFIPRCDREGYYKKEQCVNPPHAGLTCWCVTPNGSLIPGSRVKGRAHCRKLDNMGNPKHEA